MPGPLDQAAARQLIGQRHPEWIEHATRWRWLLDSWEGGDRYRYAVYGFDPFARMYVRNLVRHKREGPGPGEQPCDGIPGSTNPAEWDGGWEGWSNAVYLGGSASGIAGSTPPGMAALPNDPAASTDNDYGLRLARTPVPTFVQDAVDTHLSRVYAREVRRKGPAELEAWWADVDGKGTPIDDWMADVVAPLLMVLGQLDVLMDHPRRPDGEDVRTQADVERLGLSRCVATYILPQNLLWWRLDPTTGCYAECIVLEAERVGLGMPGEEVGGPFVRHWRPDGSTLYDADAAVVEDVPHDFGRVPIVRLFDRRKPRCGHTGQSRYEAIAELQREYYNRDSELILSDTAQAHPLLQGPEDYVKSDGTIPIGPNWLLPKKKNALGTGAASYEGFDVVDFPKDGAESIRRNKSDLRDEADRSAHLTKPAGTAGTSGGTVGQSGLSKRLDATAGNDVLAKIAATLARSEMAMARLALTVLRHEPPSSVPAAGKADEVSVGYPKQFDLATAPELAGEIAEVQSILAAAGNCPAVEEAMTCRLVRLSMPGLDDATYEAWDAEIRASIARAAAAKAAAKAATPPASGPLAVAAEQEAPDDAPAPEPEG